MNRMYQILYAPCQLLIWHPERIALVGVVLLGIGLIPIGGQKPKHWPLFAAALLWLTFAPWEYHCKKQGMNIRTDLLFIWPVLVLTTGWALFMWASGWSDRRSDRNGP
jgi:hypothetical protein